MFSFSAFGGVCFQIYFKMVVSLLETGFALHDSTRTSGNPRVAMPNPGVAKG